MSQSASKQEQSEAQKAVVISGDLHRRLKEKAQREGRKLGAMVEAKLEELFQSQQLELLNRGTE